MAIRSKKYLEKFITELSARHSALIHELRGEPIPQEGLEDGNGHLMGPNPDYRVIDALKVRLAAGDFQTILKEISKIK